MRLAVVIIATGKYIAFVPPLLQSIERHFLTNHEVEPIILSDTDQMFMATQFHTPPLGWPQSTLMRYHVLMEHQDYLNSFDFIFHMDADMLVASDIQDTEILAGATVGVLSPVGYDWPKERLPFERHAYSQAYVQPGYGERYYCGSLNGGVPEQFFSMARAIMLGVDEDWRGGYIARLHEESHLNKWYHEHPPDVTLTPEFCCPNTLTLRPAYTRRMILTLDKPELDRLKK